MKWKNRGVAATPNITTSLLQALGQPVSECWITIQVRKVRKQPAITKKGEARRIYRHRVNFNQGKFSDVALIIFERNIIFHELIETKIIFHDLIILQSRIVIVLQSRIVIIKHLSYLSYFLQWKSSSPGSKWTDIWQWCHLVLVF